MANENTLRGILMPSEILDYITREDVDKKIEALLEKDKEQRKKRIQELEDVAASPLSNEEKETLIQDIINERISGQAAIEQEQRKVALQIRRDYSQFKKHESDAFNAIVKGNIVKYDRSMIKAAEAADLVDMGLEYLENVDKFFQSFNVTKVRILSEEEAEERRRLHPEKVLNIGT